MEWIKPFRIYRVTGRLVPGQHHDANICKELITEIDDIGAVCDFISKELNNDPSGQARWQVYDAEGVRVSPHDYEMMPDGQFEIRGCKGEQVTVRFLGWDIFNYWWEAVYPEVVSEGFSGKGRDYYLSITNIFNVANQILLIVEGKKNSYEGEIAVGALRFSITRRDSDVIEVTGVIRSWPNHGKQRVEFAFNTNTELLAETVSQIRDILSNSYDIGHLLTLDRYWEKHRNSQ